MEDKAAQSFLYCPEYPFPTKSLAHTYEILIFSAGPEHPTLDPATQMPLTPTRQKMTLLREKHGADMPVILCDVHDQLHYQPKEGTKGDPWLVWIRDDGSLKTGRLKGYPRFPLQEK